MSKIKRLKKRFTAFVNQLTPDQVREQLILAYLQMETCKNALKGYDVEPVEMMDKGESSDLELFYRCKKAAEELACLNDELFHLKEDYLHLKAEDFLKGQNNHGRVPFTVKVDVSEEVKRLKKIAESFNKEVNEVNQMLGIEQRKCRQNAYTCILSAIFVFFFANLFVRRVFCRNFPIFDTL